MRHYTVAAVAVAVGLAFCAGSALGQESSATIRTYQGVSYKVVDPSLEVFYTIGELKETKEEPKTQPGIVITTSATGGGGGGEQPAGGEQEARLLRGHSRPSEITVSNKGVETRIAWGQVRTIRFMRNPLTVALLPAYISHYRYSASVTLVSGQQVEADYVNLGTTVVRGTSSSGRVDIPWEEVESIIVER